MEKLTLDAKKERLSDLNVFLVGYLEKFDVAPKNLTRIELAVEEIFVNICSYAYALGEGKVDVSLDVLQNPLTLSITFEDKGTPYNPLERTDPDITNKAEKREIGGLGIFLVKQVMDACEYKYINNTNIFTVKKCL